MYINLKVVSNYIINNFKISGLATNIPFIISLCDHQEFINGNVHTDFIPMHKEKLFESAKQLDIDDEVACCALSTILNYDSELAKQFSSSKIHFNKFYKIY